MSSTEPPLGSCAASLGPQPCKDSHALSEDLLALGKHSLVRVALCFSLPGTRVLGTHLKESHVLW